MAAAASGETTAPPPPPNEEQWPTDPSCYELVGKIGQGAFAYVWKATTTSDQDCAIKILNLDHVDTNLSEIRREVQAMRLSSHPNVLACHTAFVKDTNLWLVTQLMRKGSSLHCLQTARHKLLAAGNKTVHMEPHIMYILHETLLGLQYLHQNGQIHRDVKAGNILVDSDGHVRIADFGVSGWLVQGGAQQQKAKTFVGTPCWMAPEVMEQIHGYDFKADVWSLGITALELAKSYAPYAKYPPMKVLILTIQEDPPSLETYDLQDETDDDDEYDVQEEYSKSFSNMVDTCLQKNPAQRPTCDALLKSKYFQAFSSPQYREERRDLLKSEVCDLVEDVGSTTSTTTSPILPGTVPISIITEENRPAGTTWIFADGSQVLASSVSEEKTVEDVMEELDVFEKETGGENYKPDATVKATGSKQQQQPSGDDLEDFMDEFEKTTAGENFRGVNR